MTGAATLHVLLLATLAGLAVLLALVAARKALRDRREAAAGARRDEFAELVRAGGEPLERALRGVRGVHAETDLTWALEIVTPEGDPVAWDELRASAERSGLLARLRAGLRSRSPHRRGRAALLIGRLDADAPAQLTPLLADPDPDVRLVACASVAMSRNPRALTVLIAALEDETVAPARVIERIAAPWAVTGLLEYLPHASSHVRPALARALGLVGDPAAVPALLCMLEHGAPEERISAARALGATAALSAREPLERALRDEFWPLRAQAAKALGAIGATASAPALAVALGDSAWWVRDNAAAALTRLGPAGEAALLGALDQPDRFARERARQALTRAAIEPALRAA